MVKGLLPRSEDAEASLGAVFLASSNILNQIYGCFEAGVASSSRYIPENPVVDRNSLDEEQMVFGCDDSTASLKSHHTGSLHGSQAVDDDQTSSSDFASLLRAAKSKLRSPVNNSTTDMLLRLTDNLVYNGESDGTASVSTMKKNPWGEYNPKQHEFDLLNSDLSTEYGSFKPDEFDWKLDPPILADDFVLVDVNAEAKLQREAAEKVAYEELAATLVPFGVFLPEAKDAIDLSRYSSDAHTAHAALCGLKLLRERENYTPQNAKEKQLFNEFFTTRPEDLSQFLQTWAIHASHGYGREKLVVKSESEIIRAISEEMNGTERFSLLRALMGNDKDGVLKELGVYAPKSVKVARVHKYLADLWGTKQ